MAKPSKKSNERNLTTFQAIQTVDEMVIALVQPSGTDLKNIHDRLREGFKKVGAVIEVINLTDLKNAVDLNARKLSKVKKKFASQQKKDRSQKHSQQYLDLSEKMHIGTLFREHLSRDIFAIYGIAMIKSLRKESKNKGHRKIIYILDSLKHPAEVEALKTAYGKSFFSLGVSAEKAIRESNLRTLRGMTAEEAAELISRDEDEGIDHGQKMNDAFERSDFFFDESCSQEEVDRFVEIAFGNSKHSPTKDEFYMNLATSASAKSGDLSRQVGAVLVPPEGELISLGYNEVPRFGGGQYSEGETPDWRDVKIGHDPNGKRRAQLESGINNNPIAAAMAKNLTEYHRAVHAEMEALISCARKGATSRGATLYTTTYPCHNCAKHLINAGIEKVIYMYAYPKSLAFELHSDSLENSECVSNKMGLRRYLGVGPSRYLDFFSLLLSNGLAIARKGYGVQEGWRASIFDSEKATPRFPIIVTTALEAEDAAMIYLSEMKILRATAHSKKGRHLLRKAA